MSTPAGTSSYVRVAVAATGWGTWSLFLRPANVDPRWSSTVMLTVITLVVAPALLSPRARGPTEGPPRQPREWWAMGLLGVCDALNVAFFFAAMSVTNVALAVLSHYLAPVFVAIAAPVVLGTPRVRGAVWLTSVAVLGLGLVLERYLRGDGGRPLLGALLGAGSAVFYAANVLITKRMGARFTAVEQLVYHAALSAVLLALFSVAVRAPLPTPRGLLIVATATIFIGALGGLLYLQGLKRIPAEHASVLTFLEPITAVLVAWIAFNERPGALSAVGAAMVLSAGVLAIRAPRVDA